jgi:hypothetical protein
VTVKTVARDGGVETERVSRVSLEHWKTAAGEERWTQMVTLDGWHRHTL